jgi:hypothetical protein
VVAAHFVGRPNRTAIFDVPLLLNAAVHALMYAYYYDPQRLRPIRRWLTRTQIAQHLIVLLSILYTSATVMTGTPCDVSLAANGLSLGLYTMYLVQFIVFYVGAYVGCKTQHVD